MDRVSWYGHGRQWEPPIPLTWYDRLTNTKQFPWRDWAYIQILLEIAKEHPDLLVLMVSVRNGDTDARPPEELYRAIAEGHSVIQEILQKGRWVYGEPQTFGPA